MSLRYFLQLYTLTVLALTLTAGQVLALSIDQVRFGAHPDKTRLVLDLSEISDFRVFVLSDPYRMVIDLPSFQWQTAGIQTPPDSAVTAVRHGNLQPGVSRIVFDMNKPVAVRSAFALPRAAGKSDRLVIDYGPVSETRFSQEKNKIHGNLSTGEQAIARSTEPYRTAGLGNVTPPSPKPANVKPLIIIDPGHGGVDPGAVGHNRIFEKNVVLSLAKELRDQLLATGKYRVLLTRESDHIVKLSNRVKFARKHGGDLFISIHADSLDNKHVKGVSVYTLSEKASDKQTAKLAARENRADLIAGIDLSVEDEEVANILVDLAMRDTMNQSKFFANKLVDTFRGTNVRTLENPHRYAGFAVLKAPDIPSVLVEAGFMSNKEEARRLNSPAHRKKIAASLKKGIDAYFEQVKKNQRI